MSVFNGWLSRNAITIATLLVGIAFGYGMLANRVSALEDVHDSLIQQQTEVNDRSIRTEERVIHIQKSQEEINMKLDMILKEIK